MHPQQISLFNVRHPSKKRAYKEWNTNPCPKHLEGIEEEKYDPPKELISPMFFKGATVFIDMLDKESEELAKKILPIIPGLQILNCDPMLLLGENPDADIIITDKPLYKYQFLRNSALGTDKFGGFNSFKSQRNKIAMPQTKKNPIIVDPQQVLWAFKPTPIQSPPINEKQALPIQPKQQQTNLFQQIPTPNDSSQTAIGRNQPLSHRSEPPVKPPNSGNLIVVADASKKAAPLYSRIDNMPELRQKPLPDGVQFVSPFVNDDALIKIIHQRSELANHTSKVDDKVEAKDLIKKSKSGTKQKSSISCWYCGICKKNVKDQEKHRISPEHTMNVEKQYSEVDELSKCFPNIASLIM